MVDPTDVPIVQWILFGVQVSTLIALIIYVWKTWEMARATAASAAASAAAASEMRLTREAESRPRVAIYFAAADSLTAYIILENYSGATALDVAFQFTPVLQNSGSDDSLRFFDTPKVLPPHSRLTHVFDSWPAYLQANLPGRYSVTVTYRGLDAPTLYQEVHVLDAEPYRHRFFTERKDIHDLAETFGQFRQDIRSDLQTVRRRQEEEYRIWDVEPYPMDLKAAITQLRATWKLHQAVQKTSDSVPFGPFKRLLRKQVSTAFYAAAKEGADIPLQDDLQAVFLALFDPSLNSWGLMTATNAWRWPSISSSSPMTHSAPPHA